MNNPSWANKNPCQDYQQIQSKCSSGLSAGPIRMPIKANSRSKQKLLRAISRSTLSVWPILSQSPCAQNGIIKHAHNQRNTHSISDTALMISYEHSIPWTYHVWQFCEIQSEYKVSLLLKRNKWGCQQPQKAMQSVWTTACFQYRKKSMTF